MRTAAATALMLATAWAASTMIGLADVGSDLPNNISAPLVWLLATFVGGVVARQRFVPIAAVAWCVVWATILGILYSIAAGAGQASLAGLLGYNWGSMATTLAANVAGAMLGQLVARSRSRPNNSSKPTPLRGAA